MPHIEEYGNICRSTHSTKLLRGGLSLSMNRNKRTALLVVLIMLATMSIGVGTACAGDYVSVSSAFTYLEADKSNQRIGSITFTPGYGFDAVRPNATDMKAVIYLPTGVTWSGSGTSERSFDLLSYLSTDGDQYTLSGLFVDIDASVSGSIVVLVSVYARNSTGYLFNQPAESQRVANIVSTNPLPSSMTISTSQVTYYPGEHVVINWTPSPNAYKYGLSVWKAPYNHVYFDDRYLVFDQYVTGTSKDIGMLPVGNYAVNMKPYTPLGGGASSNIVYFTVRRPQTVAVTGLSLNKMSTSITEGSSETLRATLYPATATNKAVIWSSSKTSVATVTNGNVKALSPGTATITAKTLDGGYTANCTVTVPWTAELTIFAEANDSMVIGGIRLPGPLDDGHSWITIKNIGTTSINVGLLPKKVDPNKTVDVCTWPANGSLNGIRYNWDSYLVSKGGFSPRVSLSMYLSYKQLQTINRILTDGKNDNYSAYNNCTTFATKVWNSVSSYHLDGKAGDYYWDSPAILMSDIMLNPNYESLKSVPYDYPIYYMANGKLVRW